MVMLRDTQGEKVRRTLLYSTDTELDGMTFNFLLIKRDFQIEFLFRDDETVYGFKRIVSHGEKKPYTRI